MTYFKNFDPLLVLFSVKNKKNADKYRLLTIHNVSLTITTEIILFYFFFICTKEVTTPIYINCFNSKH